MTTRAGFVLGKEFDFVDSPGSMVDTSFLDDLPQEYRKRSDQTRVTWPGMTTVDNKDYISVDVAIAWYIHKNFPEIEVDFICGQDVTLERLKGNDCNFVLGYDALDAMSEGADRFVKFIDAFQKCGNIMPSWKVQESIYMKSKYMNRAMELGVPVAPTIFAAKGSRTPDALLQEIKGRGWKTFITKHSYGYGSQGFRKLHVEDCEADPRILQEYFSTYADCPEYVVQEFIEGFCRNWEVRCFWFNGEFLYAIGNRAAVSTSEGEKVGIISDDEIPKEFLDEAKKIGKAALKALPQLRTPNGEPIGMTCIRTDIGCSDSPVHDNDYAHWNKNSHTFFLNEIEYGGTTYFARALKFDCIPMWATLYATKAKEIHNEMKCAKLESKMTSGYLAGETSTVDTLGSISSGTSAISSIESISFGDVNETADFDP